MANPSPKLERIRLSGAEKFTSQQRELEFSPLDFWCWAVSDVASNATRGVLAEFVVAKALGIDTVIRDEWDDYDLLTKDGVKIEVKSSAYIQSWNQKKPSTPIFDIAKRKHYTDPETGEYRKYDEPRRVADIYIFALMKGAITKTSDPLDLDNWEFYVVPTSVIDERFGEYIPV
jgi:hypothetical protein